MTDDSERLAKRKAAEAWDPKKLEDYVAERNRAASDRILAMRRDGINPITGKPRRPTIVEKDPGGPHGWLKRSYDPHSAWKTSRRRGDF
jgi:hypothetical protein